VLIDLFSLFPFVREQHLKEDITIDFALLKGSKLAFEAWFGVQRLRVRINMG
jgi:hypothetical protein